MIELDAPVATMIDATNREDTGAFLDTFADDAVLVDWDREFAGKTEIARWNSNENIGTHNRFRITGGSQSGDRTTVSVVVSGDGYNGPATLIFQVRTGRIQHLLLTD